MIKSLLLCLNLPHVAVGGAGAALLYGMSSIALTLFNKYVLDSFDFHYPMVVIVFQLVVTIITLRVAHAAGITEIRPWSWVRAQKLVILSIVYNANVFFALSSLTLVSVPVYNALKRLGTVTTLGLEYILYNKVASVPIRWSVLLITVGVLLTGASDLKFDLLAYAFAGTSCVLQSVYLILVGQMYTKKDTGSTLPVVEVNDKNMNVNVNVKNMNVNPGTSDRKFHSSQGEDKDDTPLSTFEILYYNSVISLPLVCALALLSGEIAAARAYQGWSGGSWFPFVLLFASFLGSTMNFAVFLCTRLNSALTTTVTGQLKTIFTTLLGLLIFGQFKLSVLSVLGLTINSLGGAMYAYVKYQNMKRGAGTRVM